MSGLLRGPGRASSASRVRQNTSHFGLVSKVSSEVARRSATPTITYRHSQKTTHTNKNIKTVWSPHVRKTKPRIAEAIAVLRKGERQVYHREQPARHSGSPISTSISHDLGPAEASVERYASAAVQNSDKPTQAEKRLPRRSLKNPECKWEHLMKEAEDEIKSGLRGMKGDAELLRKRRCDNPGHELTPQTARPQH